MIRKESGSSQRSTGEWERDSAQMNQVDLEGKMKKKVLRDGEIDGEAAPGRGEIQPFDVMNALWANSVWWNLSENQW